MKIGEAAALAGLEPSAVRFYESRGILPPPQRSPSGYREYGADDIELLRFVRRLRSLRLPLDDIRKIVQERVGGKDPCASIREAVLREATEVAAQIEELHGVRDRMARVLSASDRAATGPHINVAEDIVVHRCEAPDSYAVVH